MSMNREAYKLANELNTGARKDEAYLIDSLDDMDMKKYEKSVLGTIRKEKQKKIRSFRGVAVAACAAVAVLAGTAAFSGEVHAAIRQLGWSISSALGLTADLADYREVVNTSVSHKGYVITLQEAVVSQDTLVTSYTLSREDGQPLADILVPDGSLYVNGKRVSLGASGSAGFLDETRTTVGIMDTFHISPDVDLSQENDFCLSFSGIGHEEEGIWEFSFAASGSDLIADTRRVAIGKEFTLPDGSTVTLEEFSANDLEQRITFSKSGSTRYNLMVMATDQAGNQVEFGLRFSDATSGYLQNEEFVDDGRLGDTAGTVTMTLYAVELPEGNGRIPDDYVQIGESFEVEI